MFEIKWTEREVVRGRQYPPRELPCKVEERFLEVVVAPEITRFLVLFQETTKM
jgi:hypothetical protein